MQNGVFVYFGFGLAFALWTDDKTVSGYANHYLNHPYNTDNNLPTKHKANRPYNANQHIYAPFFRNVDNGLSQVWLQYR